MRLALVPSYHPPRRSVAVLALALIALAALGKAALGFEPTKSPVSPDGVRAACDLPVGQHMRNTGGIDRWGRPGMGAGLCVFTSCEITSRWQNVPALGGFQKWMTVRPGGGDPKKLQQMITAFCREKGIKEPDYVQHTGGDASFLDEAMKTRRLTCVTYAGSDDFYAGGIDHMVCLAHLDPQRAAIIDNNRPGVWVWMTRSEFLVRWKARGGGWAVVFLASPPPPVVGTVPANAVPRDDTPDLQSGAAPAKTPDGKWVDRSGSSVYVERDLGGGRSECGTGTVVSARDKVSLVLTNAHVVEDGTRPLAVTVSGKSYPAKYVAGSKVRHVSADTIVVDGPDLALLSVAGDLPAVPVAGERPAVGLDVCLWGYGKKTATGGPTHKVGKTLDQQNYVGAIQLSTLPTQQGDSGSGVFDPAGNLVAVHWGGDGTAKAVRLDAVKEFLAPHLKPLVGAAVDEPENHGINVPELERHTLDGKRTYWINGREVGRPQALDAVAAGGLGLVDDSDRYHLSVVTSDPVAARAVLADPKLATALGKVHVQVYAPTDWAVRDRVLVSPVTLQEPAPKGGKVVWTGAALDAATLLNGLKRADPNYKPEPPAPVMPAPLTPGPVVPDVKPAPDAKPAPEPAPVAPAPAQPQGNAVLYLIVALIGAFFLFRKKGS